MYMIFTQEYLTDLIKGKSRGEFHPFSTGKWKKSDKYLKQIVDRLKGVKSIELEADFDHYGSGFSSYVHLYLSKSDKSDVKITEAGDSRTEWTNGLMLYLCRLAPFAIYSEGAWARKYVAGKWHSACSHFIEPENIGTTPNYEWDGELFEITKIIEQFGITCLTKEVLDKFIDFEIMIPTILTDPPYRVFDCLFYWAD